MLVWIDSGSYLTYLSRPLTSAVHFVSYNLYQDQMDVLTLRPRQVEYNEILLFEAHVASPEIW